jgi:hypothetical protein
VAPRQAGADSFLDHGPLEFGEDAHHLKWRLGPGSCELKRKPAELASQGWGPFNA